MSLDQVRKNFLPKFESYLKDYLKESPFNKASEMVTYHMATGGKRIRALIPVQLFESFGEDPHKVFPLSAGLELLHNATLVHDDLQDGDEVRREQPTVWKKYSEAQAINCGDAMFHMAYELLFKLEVPDTIKVPIGRRFSDGLLRVIEGQSQEFSLKEVPSPGLVKYLKVVRGKTSAMFGLCVMTALQALGQHLILSKEQMIAIESASEKLGIIFQINDDLVDIYGDKGRHQSCCDIYEGKISVLAAHVFDVASKADQIELNTILRQSRNETSEKDIQNALRLYEQYDSKNYAMEYILKRKKEIIEDHTLQSVPEVYQLCQELCNDFFQSIG